MDNHPEFPTPIPPVVPLVIPLNVPAPYIVELPLVYLEGNKLPNHIQIDQNSSKDIKKGDTKGYAWETKIQKQPRRANMHKRNMDQPGTKMSRSKGGDRSGKRG